ncbi:YncE family protein [Niabella ginsengisoli]|uniref:YncE family protein n=1 Tax=Niabella ginsengisoli TaxID=522298 RepID=A0ABS9SNR4_9BACT|nr:YncE family protein [Niabella ginsengisoli]MCH5599995.1 YncE family protein [Niabella ginsengisoli]
MNKTILLIAITCLLFSCRKERDLNGEESTPLPPQADTTIAGFYVLNEGNWNTNMASLDYYDYASGTYRKNIYTQANPDATLGLGDVGNDICAYGSKLYAVINASNKIEVMDVVTAKRIKTIALKNCRYITFANGKVYASAYNGEIALGPNAPNGIVVEIDTATLNIKRTAEVGRQPEEMAIVGNKLYIANSGGYSPPDYEKTVSVIDLSSFKNIKNIDVAINLHRLKADADGDLYVSSRGDYYETPSRLFVIDTKTDAVKKRFDIAAANLSLAGDSAYIIGSEFSYKTGNWENTYHVINTKTETLLNGSFIKDGSEAALDKPYGIIADPISRNIYITDAKDYVSSGVLHGYNKDGKKIFTVTSGNIPAHFAFVYKPITQ